MPRIRAPELPKSLPWLNSSQPLSLAQLKGRFVLLDFWTYGCINCLHVLPNLKYLEQKYHDSLTVIGIHSGKFDREKNLDNIHQAIRRYDITHPVLIDSDFKTWDQYAIRAYPTFVLIDPESYIVSVVSGEGKRDFLDRSIAQLLPAHQEKGAIAFQALDFRCEVQPLASPLRFPGKVLADEDSDRLFISDSGHDRIVISTLAGEVLDVVGIGKPGLTDGSYEKAQFSAPQGMAFDRANQILYVADTENHAIRQVNLGIKQVKTIAGTGKQSQILYPHGGKALETNLNSPWDLALVDEQIFIAIAGAHQIWKLENEQVMTYAGTGAEGCFDGSVVEAAFAQPSGLATDGKRLFVADSETSSIRTIDLSQDQVHTLCGSGDLYGFGDADGVGADVRLQHCLGIAYANGALWVADTYNHKIKRVDVESGKCQTLTSKEQFSEPSGISVTKKGVYIADTNRHLIWKDDSLCEALKDDGILRVRAIEFSNLCAPGVCLV